MSSVMIEEAAGEPIELTDEQLLARFVSGGDDGAFGRIVYRYAGLVLGVCRRSAPTSADADDAFQATFIVLARSAHKIRRRQSLASWLYGVASRICMRQRRDNARRPMTPLTEPIATQPDPLDELLARHESQIVDEEVAALPDSLRTPFVLRYLAEKSNAEVADELGISVAAVEGRLKRAKDRLRWKLIRRGVTLGTAVVVLKASRVAAGEVSPELLTSTVDVCCSVHAGAAAHSVAAQPASVQLANQEVIAMKTMLISKSLATATATACVVSLSIGVALAAIGLPGGGEAQVALDGVAAEAGTSGYEERAVKPQIDVNVKQAAATVTPADYVKFDPRTVFDIKSQSSQEVLRIQRSLLSPLHAAGLVFTDQPLELIVKHLQEEYGIPIQLDLPALEQQTVSPDEPVTISIHGVSLRSALRLMFKQLALTSVVKDEVLLITTPKAAAADFDVRVYPVDERWRMKPQELAMMLKSTISPDSWADKLGNVEWYPGGLVIRQTYAQHVEISELLQQIEQQASEQALRQSGR